MLLTLNNMGIVQYAAACISGGIGAHSGLVGLWGYSKLSCRRAPWHLTASKDCQWTECCHPHKSKPWERSYYWNSFSMANFPAILNVHKVGFLPRWWRCFLLFKFLMSCADPKLPSLLKMLIWAQNQLDEKASYPRINDLVNATLEEPVTWLL